MAAAPTSTKARFLCARREREFVTITAAGFVDLVLINADQFSFESAVTHAWLRSNMRLAAADGYASPTVIIRGRQV